MTPALRSTRLILYPHSPMLVTEEQVSWLNDKELMQYSEQRHHEHSLRSQLHFVREEHPSRFLWLIRMGGVDIGTMSSYADAINKRANLGILLGRREYHGQGLAAEAWTTVIDYFFDNGFNKIECGCREDNAPMRRLAQTTGFSEEAIIPHHYRVGDEYKHLVLYGRFAKDEFRSEWDQMWRPPFWKSAGQTNVSS